MLKKIALLILAVSLAFVSIVPVFAKEERQIATLSLEYNFDGGQGSGMLYALLPMTRETYDTITSMVVYYSLDGENYDTVKDAWGDEVDIVDGCKVANGMLKQSCLYSTESPLKEFKANEIERFWIKIKIDGSIYEGFTTAALLEYDTTPKPLPDEYSVETMFPKSMVTMTTDASGDVIYTGEQKISIKQGTTTQEALIFLPEQLPMTVQVLEKDVSNFAAKKTVQFKAKWIIPEDLSNMPPGEYVFKQQDILMPIEEMISVNIGIYNYTLTPPQTKQSLNLVVTIAKNDIQTSIPPAVEEEDTSDGSGGNRGDAGNSNQGNGGVRPGQPEKDKTNGGALSVTPSKPKPTEKPNTNESSENSDISKQPKPDDSVSMESPKQESEQSDFKNIQATVTNSKTPPDAGNYFIMVICMIFIVVIIGIILKTGLFKKLIAKLK